MCGDGKQPFRKIGNEPMDLEELLEIERERKGSGMSLASLEVAVEVEKSIKKNPLSSELKVACEIWHYNVLKQPIWFGKIVDNLAWCMDKNTVSESLDTLTDWVIIYGEYGGTEKGRAGYNYYVDTHDGGDFKIRDLYEKYWRDARCQ